MGWQDVALSLVSDVDDPTIRIEVLRTINFLYQVYQTGRVTDDQIYNDLFEVCLTIIRYKHPDLTPEEQAQKAKEFAERLLEEFRIGSLTRRTLGKVRGAPF